MEASAFHPSNCVASDSTRSRCPAWVPWAKAAWACGISVLFLFFFFRLDSCPYEKRWRGNVNH